MWPDGCPKRSRLARLAKPVARLLRLLLGIVLQLGLAIAPAAAAAPAPICRTVEGHHICILSIQRSAKNHWEYRAVVSVDGQRLPVEVYSCRDRQRIEPDGRTQPFEPNGPGDLICRLLR